MEEVTQREKDFMVFKVCGALICHVLGLMGFFFSLWKGNYSSAAACLVLELCCTFVIVFVKQHLKMELHLKYSARFFRVMTYVAAVFGIGSLCGCIAYIVVGTLQKETFDVRSHYAAAPIAFMAAFWFVVLFFDCRKYVSLLE